jgi:hypothetical protein
VILYARFLADLQRRKRARWAKILASETPGRGVGRRPRDPDKERILARLDRARLARRAAQPGFVARVVPIDDGGAD